MPIHFPLAGFCALPNTSCCGVCFCWFARRLDEVKKHNTDKSAWVIIHGVVHDVTDVCGLLPAALLPRGCHLRLPPAVAACGAVGSREGVVMLCA